MHQKTEFMKHLIIVFSLLLASVLKLCAQSGSLKAITGKVKNGYNFWLYTPKDYTSEKQMPVIVFLHGKSLCGNNLSRVRRYGTIHAIDKGREIPALVIAPQNNGGAWKPEKIMNCLKWVEDNYAVDTNRVYAVGISLGGYGTLDFIGTYPDKIAAAMELCGGTTLKDFTGLSQVPLWIFHGTADKAVPISASQKVIDGIEACGGTDRHIFTKLKGFNHGAPARILYLKETYDWLLEHALTDKGRPVNRTYNITPEVIKQAYKDLHR